MSLSSAASFGCGRKRLLAGSCLLGLVIPGVSPALASDIGALFVTSSVYAGTAGTVVVGQPLPNSDGAIAVVDGSYPGVFANEAVDPNFGITSPIELSAFLTTATDRNGVRVGPLLDTLDLTALTGASTSFSSKSELAVNVSTDGTALTLMGYVSPSNVLDVSNSNTPGFIDPTNTDLQAATYRAVIELSLGRGIQVTPVSAYSGNNGRAAILARDVEGTQQDAYLMVGNAGNGSGVEPVPIAGDTGVQLAIPGGGPTTTAIGTPQGIPGAKNGYQLGFSVASLGDPPDKSGKDDNFRGETVFDNHLYVSKGSGGNGVNTVYQVSAGSDPSAPGDASVTILPGFPTGLAADVGADAASTVFYPFGLWFANKTTLYVADEGVQSLSSDPNAGLQKWMFNGTRWLLAYTLQNGLQLDQVYGVKRYPAALAPATTGLRNLTGGVQGDQVTIFATTATYSNNTDPGADPNQVVRIVDQLDATTLPPSERFNTVRPPAYGRVYRGVAYVQCGTASTCLQAVASARP